MNLRVLATLLIATIIGSGCATTERFIEPLCTPSRPTMIDMSIEDQLAFREWDLVLFTGVALNDLRLKRHIATIENLIEAHNEQFEAECY